MKKALKSAARVFSVMLLSGACEFAAFFLLVRIPFFPTLLSQTVSTVAGISGKFLFSKLIKYKDGFSADRLKKQIPRFFAATLFLIGAGNLLLSVLYFFTDYLMISKAIVTAATAISGALIYKYFVFNK